MKRLFPSVLAGAAALILSGVVHAEPANFNVTSMKKRFDVERNESMSTKFSHEKWGYSITIENKSFKILEDLNVEYRQYMVDDVVKGEAKLKAIPGSIKIARLPNAAKFKFDTEPVVINKSELKANWSYVGGGKEKVKDSVAGFWLRIMNGGEVLFEIQTPPEFKSKMTW